MINEWLYEVEREIKYPQFNIIDLNENDLDDKDELKKFLSNQVLIHLTKPIKLKRIYKNKPSNKLKTYILNLKLPPEDAQFNPRQSFWAEIISAEILEKIKNFILPIYKLRYKETRDKAMRGKADVVACKIIEEKPLIIFSEVKSKTVYTAPSEAKKIANAAFKGLSSNNVEFPEIIDYISDILEDLPDDYPNKYNLIHLFDNALLNPKFYSKEFHIFFVFEKDKWKEECLEIFDEEKLKELPNLTINIVLINSLKSLIDDTYLLVPKSAEELVYG